MSTSVKSPAEQQNLVAGFRRRISIGTRVESRTRSMVDEDGHRRWAIGVVVGHEPSLDLPLIEWDDDFAVEALEDDQYEVAGCQAR